MNNDSRARSTAQGNRASIDITVLWNDEVLEVVSLRPPCTYWLGDAAASSSPRVKAKASRPCDFVVPEGLLGAEQAPLVVAEHAEWVGVVLMPTASITMDLPGFEGELSGDELRAAALEAGLTIEELAAPEGACCLRLPRHAQARVRYGCIGFRIAIGAAEARIVRTRPWRKARAALCIAGTSLALHGALGAAGFFSAAAIADDSGLTPEQRYLVQYYLEGAEERALEEAEQEAIKGAPAAEREGGSGARARGERGSMGASGPSTGTRYGGTSPSSGADAHVAREASLRDAAEFGMIGLLSSGSGGDPDAPTAPWGRDDSQGTNFGGGGLALSGVGAGGGGRGQGVGLGTNGMGFGSGQGRLGGNSPAAPSGGLGGGNHSAGPAVGAGNEEVSPVRATIDPNGRFSTTYRPGHGHLAAFETAVARGLVPTAARELVSDVGARYAATLDAPTHGALSYAVDLERQALPPSGGPVHVRVSLRSSALRPTARPHLSVHLVLDVSGSMQGEPIARAREAAQKLVDELAPTDEFSLVAFSSEAKLVVGAGLVGPRRASIHSIISEVNDGGGTNIGEALRLAFAQARLHATGATSVPVVMLLSDGQPTVGERQPGALANQALEAFQSGIQTSTFGLGTQYDGELMSMLASDGAGGYYYLRDADQIAPALHTELAQRLEPSATAVEVRVRLNSDVSLLHVYGSRRLSAAETARERAKEVAADTQAAERHGIRRDRQHDADGGMRFFIPAFGRDDSYSLLFEVAVPAGTAERAIGSLELKYKDVLLAANAAEESPIRVSFAKSDAESAQSANVAVARTIQGHLAGEALLSAAQSISRGDTRSAVTLLGERGQILRTAAETLGEPGFLRDAQRFSRLLAHVTGEAADINEPRALAMVLETAARSHLQ